MFSRTAAILLALMALLAAASSAGAQPRGGHGGGWGGFGGAFHGGGGFRGGGPFGGGQGRGLGGGFGGTGPRSFGGWGGPRGGGGWRAPRMDGGGGYDGFEGRGFRSGPAPFAGRSYVSPPVRLPPPSAGRSFSGGEGRAAFDGDWRAQQNEVRQAVREGRHIPLNQAIEAVRRRTPGRELDAGLEAGPDGRSVYRLRWAGQNGRRQDYLVDAGSGAIVGVLGGP